ncbi:gp436 family protein [Nioella sp.]|uniref:gp436 family protein n=1 Tax=Nioella sp. TaxID=1912091 RepID=UPI003510F03E
MSYATLLTLTDRFGAETLVRLTDRADPPAGVIDEDVVERALADTDGVIDGYLRARYVTPLTEVPPQITDIALSIAIYRLHRWEPDTKIRRDYEDALRSLREIANGTIRLTATTVAPMQSGETGARLTDRERPFTAQNLKGFI